jgi:hypothetical protein
MCVCAAVRNCLLAALQSIVMDLFRSKRIVRCRFVSGRDISKIRLLIQCLITRISGIPGRISAGMIDYIGSPDCDSWLDISNGAAVRLI